MLERVDKLRKQAICTYRGINSGGGVGSEHRLKHAPLCNTKDKNRLCIKVGRGQGDGDIGTRVWGLGTWGRETRDLRTSSMGRGDVWDGDAGTSNTGTQGRGM